jgi:hypothetical protein
MAIPLQSLPQTLQKRVGPDAPDAMRTMVSKALMPMGPEELFLALGYLATNEKGELATDARRSLQTIPSSVLQGVLRKSRDVDVLDFAVHEYNHDEMIVELLILNPHVPDVAIEWLARRVSGRLLTIIATNQERIVRHAQLVEAIYYNPEAPMIVVQRVFETAVRSGLSLHHLPGFREIYISIFDKEPTTDDPLQDDLEELPIELELPPSADAEPEPAAAPLPDIDFGEEGIEDDDYLRVLREAALEEDEGMAASESSDTGTALSESLYQRVRKMTIAQKVRLALVGGAMARALLIRDPKIVVAMAVLKSPKLTVKEIASFAKIKSTTDQVIQAICRNREWTRNYRIQFSLLCNPKTPVMFTNRWIRNVTDNDLKKISRSHEVPGHVIRLAKNIINQKEKAKDRKR